MYSGEYVSPKGNKDRYHLLVYKGTKIIHTLYPDKSRYNAKRVHHFNLERASVNAEHDIINCIATIQVLYKDHPGAILYKVFFIRHQVPEIEKCHIEFLQDDKPVAVYFVGQRDCKWNNMVPEAMLSFKFADLRYVERIINEHYQKHLPGK